ncbi:MAG: DUF1501 domain-containing protein [bacterium]
MKRRDFLKYSGAAITGVPFMMGNSRATALFDSPTHKLFQPLQNINENILVMIYLEGGNDGLNTVVPFEDTLYDVNRPSIGFTSPAEKKSLTFRPRPELGMNPSMNSLQPFWDEGKLAIIQNVGNSNPDLSHFRSSDIWNSASDPTLNISTGWTARYLEGLYPDFPSIAPEDPLAISIGYHQSAAFFGSKGLVNIRIDDPRTYLGTAEQHNKDVPNTEGGVELAFMRSLISLSNVYASRFSNLFPKFATSTVVYPNTQIANDLQKIAWCIGSGLKTKVYYAHLKGFDTHGAQFSKDPNVDGHAKLLKDLSEALFAFQRDLEGLKVDQKVMTMTYSEFGRRISGTGGVGSGTDHGTAAPQFLLGSPIAGEMYGKNPDLAHPDANGNLVYEFEFRQTYASILQHWFGMAPAAVATLLNPSSTPTQFKTIFPINGKATEQSLFRKSAYGVNPSNIPKPLRTTISPNPCRDDASLSVSLEHESVFHVTIYDVEGRFLGDLHNSIIGAGLQKIGIKMSQFLPGSYTIKMEALGGVATQKLIKL